METLDRNLQRRVWSRVYPGRPGGLTPQQRQRLHRCLVRSKENLAVYEKMVGHGLYGPAFEYLSQQTQEEIKMLMQMLQ